MSEVGANKGSISILVAEEQGIKHNEAESSVRMKDNLTGHWSQNDGRGIGNVQSS